VRYVVWGWAAVFDPDGGLVADRSVLRDLSGYVDDEDLCATDYLGGTDEEDRLAAALERGGRLRFDLRDGEEWLRVFNEYHANRPLSESEVARLREYTAGQWSDGMGECVFVPRGPYKDYKLQPLDRHEVSAADYPFVEVVAD
jgi:hypothetical protein